MKLPLLVIPFGTTNCQIADSAGEWFCTLKFDKGDPQKVAERVKNLLEQIGAEATDEAKERIG